MNAVGAWSQAGGLELSFQIKIKSASSFLGLGLTFKSIQRKISSSLTHGLLRHPSANPFARVRMLQIVLLCDPITLVVITSFSFLGRIYSSHMLWLKKTQFSILGSSVSVLLAVKFKRLCTCAHSTLLSAWPND